MLKYIVWVVFQLCIWCNVVAQAQDLSKKSEKEWFYIRSQIELRRFEAIIPSLQKFVESNPQFLPAGKSLVQSYLYTFRYQEAADYAASTIQKYSIQDKDWWGMLAQAYEKLQQYPEAISALQNMAQTPYLGKPYQELIRDKISKLQYTWDMKQHPVPFDPISLGSDINTPYFELYPFLSPDGNELYFTRMAKNEDIYVAEKVDGQWTNAKPLPFNTLENEGAGSVSSDGKIILFTACNHPNRIGSCDIFYTISHNGTWSTPKGLGAPINTVDWESQASMSANGMAIVFSSIRPGGKGSRDLYISYLNSDNQWMAPQNLGSVINTPGDEETPFIHADGRTLYFSSNGRMSVGGKDLYVSRLSDDGVWSEPVNLGYPINTEGDESSIYVALDGKSAFIASDRKGGNGKLDIYEFVLHDSVRANPATYVKAIVRDAKTDSLLHVKYSIFNYNTNKEFSHGQTYDDGAFLICIPAENTYRLQIEKEGYLFYSEQFQAQPATMLKPHLLEVKLSRLEKGANIVLKNVLYKTDSYELEAVSFPELQNLIKILNENPQLHADIQGYTDNVGSPQYNLELSEKRAQSVVNYLIENGISKGRLTAKGFGATRPVADNNTEEGRQENRRTEFVIVN